MLSSFPARSEALETMAVMSDEQTEGKPPAGEPSLTTTIRLQYLVPQESFPVALLPLDQFEDWLVAPHLPAAALSIDASLKLQLGPVAPSVCLAPEHVRDVKIRLHRTRLGPLNILTGP